jgi:phage baseplate assembly protein W
MATLTKLYSDIDFAFTKKPVTNDVALSYDAQAVIRSIRNLLLTNHYERLWNPDLGSNLNDLLFELMTPMTASSLEREVKIIIQNYEPRATIHEIIVSPLPDKNAYNIYLSFFMENTTLPTTVTFLLERNR